ncbi:MAG TPA: FAD-dependent oxidoreductase [Isosphaeraceae bacterium]|nr:FAD-dependent oxidoreductase [Isosphaeraceae bacterium]
MLQKKRIGIVSLAIGFVLTNLAHAQPAREPRTADVVVYGGSAAGVIASVAAAREDQSVILLEPGRHLGGMVSGGLGATDFGKKAAIGGYSLEFFHRVRDHYVETYGAGSPQVRDCDGGYHFEPHVAEAIFKEMLNEADVKVVTEARLDKVEMDGKAVKTISTKDGKTYAAKVFIDASYEGDLMARAGVSYTVGREGRDQYGEKLAGVQQRSPAHQWPVPVSATDSDGNLLPCVQPGPPDEAGTGDKKVQAYNYRLCMTQVPENRFPFPKPEGYDPARYELLARYLAKKPDLKVGQLMNPVRMPNGKTDTNNNGAFSTDHIGANWDYPEADEKRREEIRKDHVAYVQGFLYFLANDPRVPTKLHEEMNTWGLAKDEFKDTDHWPNQLYVREARRMIGEYVMIEKDIMTDRKKDDSIGLGSYNTDSHHVQRVEMPDGTVLNEGDFQVHTQPYAIAYRSLVPKQGECENLLVPLCMSASHVAYGSIRMEPVYMIMGQACGVASALAIENHKAVQDVDTDSLTRKLLEQKAILSPDEVPSLGGGQGVDPNTLKGVVVDDDQAEAKGEWSVSTSVGPYIGSGYRHDGDQEKGKRQLIFRPKLAKAGKYEVRFFYTPNPNRATNVPVEINGKGIHLIVHVNERKGKAGEPFPLGTFAFEPGSEASVTVVNEGTDGHVVADAVQFVPVP